MKFFDHYLQYYYFNNQQWQLAALRFMSAENHQI